MQMKMRMSFGVPFACGLAFVMLAGSAQAQIAKSGSFEGVAAWSSYGEVTEIGNGNYWHGGFNGAFLNSAGSGFLHNTALTCPGAGVTVGGRQFYQGSCVLTDADGDQAAATFGPCEMQANGICPGPMSWVAGTGKYKGISGEFTFEGRFIGNTTQGVSHWKGEWKLP